MKEPWDKLIGRAPDFVYLAGPFIHTVCKRCLIPRINQLIPVTADIRFLASCRDCRL